MLKHEDNRRTLIEWIQDAPVRSCKIVIAKEDTEIGGHHHDKKDEIFYLLSGKGEYKLDEAEFAPLNKVLYIRRGTKHSFRLSKDSVLLGAATEPFNPNDEII
jgi:mannose-6-phosphate isomerase-like protein (cupin superfamily)